MEKQPFDAKALTDDRSYRLLGWGMLVFTFVLLLGWAALAPLESAVVASGRINVASLNKSVQHLDGGLIETIAVRDGDLVEQGQLLLALDPRPLQIKLDNVLDQLIETDANLERLAAERELSLALRFSSELQQRAEGMKADYILDTQQHLFESRRQSLLSEQDILRQRLAKTHQEIADGEELAETLRHRKQLLEEDQEGLNKLARKKLVSQAKLREVQRQHSELQGDIIERVAENKRLISSLPEISSQLELLGKDYRKEVISQQRDLQARRMNLDSERRSLEEKLGRIEIRAPVAGKIKGLEVVTTGAVIPAGATLMEIVPQERDFRIHARVSPMDIDALYPGLKAEIRVPVFDGSQHFPSLYTELEDVSTDVYMEERTGEAYYKATLKVDRESFAVMEKEKLKLVSGMPVEVVIKTGERTLLDYLVKPLRDMAARTFNEA